MKILAIHVSVGRIGIWPSRNVVQKHIVPLAFQTNVRLDPVVMVDLHAMFKISSRRKIHQMQPLLLWAEEEEEMKLQKLTRMIHVGPIIVVKIGQMQVQPARLSIGVQMQMTHYVQLACHALLKHPASMKKILYQQPRPSWNQQYHPLRLSCLIRPPIIISVVYHGPRLSNTAVFKHIVQVGIQMIVQRV
jgi:hypothetical protein